MQRRKMSKSCLFAGNLTIYWFEHQRSRGSLAHEQRKKELDMTKERSHEELKSLSMPTLCFLRGPGDFVLLGKSLVEIARSFPPARAKIETQRVCSEIGLDRKIVDGIARSCRYLTILRVYYPEEFEKAVKDNSVINHNINAHADLSLTSKERRSTSC